MTDPERISRRSSGLSGQLLRAGLEEQPSVGGVERTLAALGVSAAVVTSGAAAHAAATGVKLGGAATGGVVTGTAATGTAVAVKATSAALLVKWIGIGVVGGVGLAGAASVVATPAASSPSPIPPVNQVRAAPGAPQVSSSGRALASEDRLPPEVFAPAEPPRVAARGLAPLPAASSTDAVAAPLAAEVTLVDEARTALLAGQSERALLLLARYQRDFPTARLLPEALFLQLEACERLGRTSEARASAERLLRGYPQSPHAARARQLLEP